MASLLEAQQGERGYNYVRLGQCLNAVEGLPAFLGGGILEGEGYRAESRQSGGLVLFLSCSGCGTTLLTCQ